MPGMVVRYFQLHGSEGRNKCAKVYKSGGEEEEAHILYLLPPAPPLPVTVVRVREPLGLTMGGRIFDMILVALLREMALNLPFHVRAGGGV